MYPRSTEYVEGGAPSAGHAKQAGTPFFLTEIKRSAQSARAMNMPFMQPWPTK